MNLWMFKRCMKCLHVISNTGLSISMARYADYKRDFSSNNGGELYALRCQECQAPRNESAENMSLIQDQRLNLLNTEHRCGKVWECINPQQNSHVTFAHNFLKQILYFEFLLAKNSIFLITEAAMQRLWDSVRPNSLRTFWFPAQKVHCPFAYCLKEQDLLRVGAPIHLCHAQSIHIPGCTSQLLSSDIPLPP